MTRYQAQYVIYGYSRLFYGNWKPTHAAKVYIREGWEWLTTRPLTGGRWLSRQDVIWEEGLFAITCRGTKILAVK